MFVRKLIKIVACGLLFALAACTPAEKPFTGVRIGKPYEINGKTYTPAPDPSYDKIGDASWYGPGFDGKRTASGEIFDEDDLTAAHPTLPMPSLVKVTSMQNGKSVVVRINDRGPFHSNRIIDLSKGSAKAIGLKSTKPVRVVFLDKETEEYIDSIQGKSPVIDMVAYNEEYNRKESERKEAMLAAQEQAAAQAGLGEIPSGGLIEQAAPVQSIASSDIAKPQAKPQAGANFPIKDAAAEENAVVARNERGIGKKGKEVNLFSADEPVEEKTVEKIEEKPAAPEPVKSAPVLQKPDSSVGEKYMILAGSFSSQENAGKLAATLGKEAALKGLVAVEKTEVAGKDMWRVKVGGFAGRDKADAALAKIRSAGVKDPILKKAAH